MKIVTQKVKYPKLVNFDKQDTSCEYGYHWTDFTNEHIKSMKLNNRFDEYFKSSILIKQNEQYDYYMPLEMPYEIKEDPNSDNYYGSKIICHDIKKCEALQKFMTSNMFIPDIEFIRSIPAAWWWNIYIEILKMFPEKNEDLHKFSFWVLDGNINGEFYKLKHISYSHTGFKCYPFLNIIRKKNGDIVYGDKTFIYLDRNDHGRHIVDNILSSCDDEGSILPVIKIKRKEKK